MRRLARKPFLLLLMVIFLGAGLVAGCGGKGGEKKPAESEKKYVVKFAHNQQVDSPQHEGALVFKKLAEEWSKGRLEVQVYPAQQLGGMREVVEGVQTGAIEMAQQPTSILTNFAPQLAIVDTPFLWPNEEVLWKVLDGEVGKEMLASLENVGMKGFHLWGAGFKHLTANKPLRTPADCKGLKFRVMPSPLLVAQFESWGASAVPIDFGELYNALQQKVIDGQENPLQTTKMLKLWEVQKCISLTSHGYIAYPIIANKKWFESLPADLQDVIVRAEAEAAKQERQILKEEEAQYLAEVEKSGMQIVRLTDEEVAAYRKASEACWPAFGQKVGTDFFQKVQEAIKAAQQ